MTRKRFEKKMMAIGVSRNATRLMANRRPTRFTYDQWLYACRLGVAFRLSGGAFLSAGTALRNLLQAARFACGEVPKDE